MPNAFFAGTARLRMPVRDHVISRARSWLSNPWLYGLVRRAGLIVQYVLRRPDDPDFRAFARLSDRDGLIVDIGANGGQAAVAFAFLLPRHRILSFEPNPALWSDLAFVAKLIGPRFTLDRRGLGAEPGCLTLHVPVVGALPITTRASMLADVATQQANSLADSVGRAPSVRQVEVQVATFDSLGLEPDGVKIDVEGYELEVLEGMTCTLKDSRPMLMVETNARDAACQSLLVSHGYRIMHYDRDSGTLVAPNRDGRVVNWFAVPAPLGGNANDTASGAPAAAQTGETL